MNTLNPIHETTLRPQFKTMSPDPAGADAHQAEAVAGNQPPAPEPSGGVDQQDMKELAKEMQDAIAGTAAAPHSVVFRQEDDSHSFVIEIRDPEGELIKQFPPEKTLNLRSRMDELTGMVIDQMT